MSPLPSVEPPAEPDSPWSTSATPTTSSQPVAPIPPGQNPQAQAASSPWSDRAIPAHWPQPPHSQTQPSGLGGPPSAPPTESIFRRHLPMFVSLAVGLLALFCLGGAIAAIAVGKHMFAKTTTHPTVTMGQPVRDGNFMFTADKMQCGVHQLGTPDDYQTPTGQFCIITIKITNVGKEPAVYADSIQRAYAPNGSRYTADTPAGFYANPDPLIFMNEINPGNHIDVQIVYDIPNSGSISRLELHENPYSRGAVVKMPH